jgi:hypothetical protein
MYIYTFGLIQCWWTKSLSLFPAVSQEHDQPFKAEELMMTALEMGPVPEAIWENHGKTIVV